MNGFRSLCDSSEGSPCRNIVVGIFSDSRKCCEDKIKRSLGILVVVDHADADHSHDLARFILAGRRDTLVNNNSRQIVRPGNAHRRE